jgi:hypothetical protein
MTPYKSERASNTTSPVDHTEKRKMIMASKDNKRKYVDGAKEEAEEVPPKKQRMINDDNGDDIDDDNIVGARGGSLFRGGGNEHPSRIQREAFDLVRPHQRWGHILLREQWLHQKWWGNL